MVDRPTMTAGEFAAALARRELSFRARMVQVMLLCALVRHPLPDDVADNVADFARELGVEEGMVDVAREFAAGSLGLAALDFTRNGYEGTWHEEESVATAALDPGPARRLGGSLRHDPRAGGALGLTRGPARGLHRAQGVGDVPGPRLHLPGTPGSAPPLLAQHDWVHVLADYGTTVESEVEVFGLIARANDDMHAFSLLAMVISLFETGYLARGPDCSSRRRATSRRARAWRSASPTPWRGAPAATTPRPAPTASTSSGWTGSPWPTAPVPTCGSASTCVRNRRPPSPQDRWDPGSPVGSARSR